MKSPPESVGALNLWQLSELFESARLQPPPPPGKSGPGTLREEVVPIAEALCDLLEDPFGRRQKGAKQAQQAPQVQTGPSADGAWGGGLCGT
ncbi:hypothetical protein H2199_005766 [Coniosporium tulheliwenetii]|uniref:Uncharacterized protein n=1 Tax=Coniosporium tulheliwenetii TaxID=3383036 RepID=A0ACC2Z0I9_9PEZI|nr:hypothetical protein H2199_005766 [Cladosporium sp. JES 115]